MKFVAIHCFMPNHFFTVSLYFIINDRIQILKTNTDKLK